MQWFRINAALKLIEKLLAHARNPEPGPSIA
jgi:hypothetical protein